jgi:hypothetical protein
MLWYPLFYLSTIVLALRIGSYDYHSNWERALGSLLIFMVICVFWFGLSLLVPENKK